MKFELTETIPVGNPDEVLRVLEQHLRAVAGDVVRSDAELIAYGIGPSPRTVNRRDTTVIEARAQDGATTLQVTVTYQASALLGNMPQDSIVRSKIEGAIDEMRGELRVWKAWAPPPSGNTVTPVPAQPVLEDGLPVTQQVQRRFEAASEAWPVAPLSYLPVAKSVAVPEPVPVERMEAGLEAVAETPDRSIKVQSGPGNDIPLLDAAPIAVGPVVKVAAQKTKLTQVGEETLPTAPPAAETPSIPRAERSGIRLSKKRKRISVPQSHSHGTAESSAATATTTPPSAPQRLIQVATARPQDAKPAAAKAIESTVAAIPKSSSLKSSAGREVPLTGLLRGQGLEAVNEDTVLRRESWKTAVIVAILLLVAGSVTAYVMRDSLPIPAAWKLVAEDWVGRATYQLTGLIDTVSTVSGNKPVVAPPPAPVKTPAVEVPKPDAVTDPEVMVKPESSIYLWVQDWASALRSKDPVAQASYYADSVQNYLGQQTVSYAEIVQAKKNAIAERSELWSVKVEHIYVESQSGDTMSVRLIKRTLSRNALGTTSEKRMKVRLRVLRTDGTWKIVDEQELGPPAPVAA